MGLASALAAQAASQGQPGAYGAPQQPGGYPGAAPQQQPAGYPNMLQAPGPQAAAYPAMGPAYPAVPGAPGAPGMPAYPGYPPQQPMMQQQQQPQQQGKCLIRPSTLHAAACPPRQVKRSMHACRYCCQQTTASHHL
jgi:hypothetical protein